MSCLHLCELQRLMEGLDKASRAAQQWMKVFEVPSNQRHAMILFKTRWLGSYNTNARINNELTMN